MKESQRSLVSAKEVLGEVTPPHGKARKKLTRERCRLVAPLVGLSEGCSVQTTISLLLLGTSFYSTVSAWQNIRGLRKDAPGKTEGAQGVHSVDFESSTTAECLPAISLCFQKAMSKSMWRVSLSTPAICCILLKENKKKNRRRTEEEEQKKKRRKRASDIFRVCGSFQGRSIVLQQSHSSDRQRVWARHPWGLHVMRGQKGLQITCNEKARKKERKKI